MLSSDVYTVIIGILQSHSATGCIAPTKVPNRERLTGAEVRTRINPSGERGDAWYPACTHPALRFSNATHVVPRTGWKPALDAHPDFRKLRRPTANADCLAESGDMVGIPPLTRRQPNGMPKALRAFESRFGFAKNV